MLSFLSMILSSGTVLRSDSEEWTSKTYPDPRVNFTQCHTWAGSTLCDPDRILTDQWRLDINNNINLQNDLLKHSDNFYNENAPKRCLQNSTEVPKIYVILAKRIQIQLNQTTNDDPVANFVDKIAKEYELESQQCRNFIMIVGVGDAKRVYIRTGQDLELPNDFMNDTFEKYNDLFNAKNYMEGLNKVITEMAQKIIGYFEGRLATQTVVTETVAAGTEKLKATPITELPLLPSAAHTLCTSIHSSILNAMRWIYIVTSICLFLATAAFVILLINYLHANEQISGTVIHQGENVATNKIMLQQQQQFPNQSFILTCKLKFLKTLHLCIAFLSAKKQFCIMPNVDK